MIASFSRPLYSGLRNTIAPLTKEKSWITKDGSPLPPMAEQAAIVKYVRDRSASKSDTAAISNTRRETRTCSGSTAPG